MATRKHMTIAEKMTVIKENENNPKISAANLNCKSKSKCISLILQKRTIYSLSKKFGPYSVRVDFCFCPDLIGSDRTL